MSKNPNPKHVKTLKPFRARKTGEEWWITSPAILAFRLTIAQARKAERALNSTFKELYGPKKKKGGAYSRRKGHAFEREIAVRLRPYFPKCRRHLEYHSEDANGVDLVETEHFRFQCKKLKTYVSVNTIKEIEHEKALGEIPVLITAGDNEPAMAVLPLDDLLSLLPRRAK